MSDIKYFIGPMTKNVVDAIIEFSNETGELIGLIPSRRQIEHDGGYVYNWSTVDFKDYVKSRNANIILCRDHAGPGQGDIEDDGYESLKTDCHTMDMIHIDPWKRVTTIKAAAEKTCLMIASCYRSNPEMVYEIGTEESIFQYQADELNNFISLVKQGTTPEEFNQIRYVVIQSGTSLKGNLNTGQYDKDRLLDMIQVANKWRLLSKEHNGDYIPVDLIKEKMSLGLTSINIAPEFGQIETKVYLDKVKKDPELFGKLYEICYISSRWQKWVDSKFDPEKNKEQLINICGHYIVSNLKFVTEIKNKFLNIDDEIKIELRKKLYELYR